MSFSKAHQVARCKAVAIVVLTFAIQSYSIHAITLPRVIDSNMVLQRGQSVPIWGWAAPGEKVSVEFASQKKSATAGKDGHWEVSLSKLETSSAPRLMVIAGSETITLTNILVGEVWLCSG